MSVNIRPMNLFNLFIFLASVYPVLSWRSSRYGGFGELSDYPLARPHHHGMTGNQLATTFRLAGSLSESQPISTNPFNKYGLPRKRDDKLKRCGKVLVKFVMQVCDYCITPSNTKQVDVSSRRKRQAGIKIFFKKKL